mgnify:CR=1 FL=1
MKTLLTILFTLPMLSQVYADFSVDPNQMLGIVDNPRTSTEIFGFDYDLEIGARDRKFSVYVFYGAFQEIDYQNYGAGVDYYITLSETLEGTVGIGNGVVMRKQNDKWGGYMSPAIRSVFIVNINRNIAITLKSQLQNRPDIGKLAIYEGSIGIRLKK